MHLDQPFAVAPNPCGSRNVVACEVRFAASDFAGAAIGNDGRVGREHAGLMIAELEADHRADVEIRHELVAGLNRFFHLDVIRQQHRLEGAEIVRLQRSPHPDLLDEDEVRLGVDVFGGRDLLGADNGEARGEQHEQEDCLHGSEFNLNAPDCILHFWR
jgi:hypothetical protein